MTPDLGPASLDAWSRVAGWPGVRTLRSPTYRLVLGASLWLVGIAMLGPLLLGLADSPSGQFGVDFGDYRAASLRLLEGRSPYTQAMLTGPVDAQGARGYRYPPPLAQLISPIAVLPIQAGATVWLAIQVTLIFVSTWMAGSAAGGPRSWERFIWTGVVLTYFFPVFDTLWKGNVEGPIALSVSLLLAAPLGHAGHASRRLRAGVLAGAVAVIKLAPAAVVPAVVRVHRQVAVGALLGMGLLVLPSLVLAPNAWMEYARVIPNLLTGDAGYANNLAPAIVAANLGAPAALVALVRLVAVGTAIVLIGVSVRLAGRSDYWPAALGCAVVASLLLPAVLWYHYPTVLVPLAAYAWVRAGRAGRLALIGGGALVNAGLVFPAIATLGAAILAASSTAVVWPGTGLWRR